MTGSGTAEAVPDLLTVSIGVECRREDVGAAYAAAGRASAGIIGGPAGARCGRPRTSAPPASTSAPTSSGRKARARPWRGTWPPASWPSGCATLPASSEVIAEAVGAGGNDVRLNGLDLGFADPAAVTAQAREAAWQDALATAGQFASLAGAELGPVVSVTQQPGVAGTDSGGENAARHGHGLSRDRGRPVERRGNGRRRLGASRARQLTAAGGRRTG